LGTLSFTPALVFSTGYDTNVYREPNGFADYETFAVPQIEGWWTRPGFRISAHGAVEWVNFQHNVGATNGQVGARIDRTNSLVKPFFGWNRRRTNAGPTGFEAGYKSLRLEQDLSAGLKATVWPRMYVEGLVRLVRTRWDADAIYQTSSLREKLNRDTVATAASFGYAITSLTAVGFSVDTQQDRFQFSSIRDGTTVRFGPTVEFASTALLFGTARVGYERFRSPASGAADFNGPFANVNLGYGGPDHLQVKLLVGRDVQYSYDPALAYYVSTNVNLSAAKHIGEHWDVAVFTGRYGLDFRPPGGVPSARPQEGLVEFGGAAAYRFQPRARIGWTVEHARKTGAGEYSALRVVGFLTFGSGRFQRLDRPTPFER
jgi:hypothetical protein